MSIESAAERAAERILEEHYVEVYGHNDADGIAAAGILCHALSRTGVRFRLRIVREVTEGLLTPGTLPILCDLGNGSVKVPEEAVVIDHHVPHFGGPFHVNPNLAGINGEQELSASGASYLVAECMGTNQDLAGLVLVGILGDGQLAAGKNREILSDGIAEGVIVPARGIPLAGRSLEEQLLLCVTPYLPGISGDPQAVQGLMNSCSSSHPESVLSLVVLRTGQHLPAGAFSSLWGDVHTLQRETVSNCHDMTALLDACGRSGEGGLGASICLRHQGSAEQAWKVLHAYRQKVITALRAIQPREGPVTMVEVPDAEVISSVADALIPFGGIIVVMARAGTQYRLTSRCPAGSPLDLEQLNRKIAQEFGGNGGGHRCRAGATFPADQVESVKKRFMEALA
jgi:hypothetical protein